MKIQKNKYNSQKNKLCLINKIEMKEKEQFKNSQNSCIKNIVKKKLKVKICKMNK